ncbi:NADAR family protein [Roseovarius sp.]|uniref:NADAR family protein n=1 Tax=Roseovarius sp. TaxID=1486281 RepID=UPI0026024976|nr:NADAR family protein [Roseovarius sp.]MDM8168655.1 NADAR family protein [Roseovarius sp.]
MTTPQGYHFFWSGPFSQWQPCRMSLWEVEFNCAEQAMMYGKALMFEDRDTASQILAAQDPGKQKALGRTVRGFDEGTWANGRYALVREVNLAKFDQNKGLRRKLFQTAPKPLAEASPMDTIWGIGLDADTAAQTPVADWPGQNLLGRILTEIRDELSTRHPAEAAACMAGE